MNSNYNTIRITGNLIGWRRISIFITLLILIFHQNILLANNKAEDAYKRAENLRLLDGSVQSDSLKALLFDLYVIGWDASLPAINYLIDSVNFNTPDQLVLFRHFAKTSPANNQHLLDSCLKFIDAHELDEFKSSIYILKANFYDQSYQYDSAMLNILMAREWANKYNDLEEVADILHQTGDLYFHTGYYRKARQYYLELNDFKGDTSIWNTWRKRVIRNNLGLIEEKSNNFKQARIFFQTSYLELDRPLKTNYDSIYFAYLQLNLAILNIEDQELQQAEERLDSAFVIYQKYGLKKEIYQCLDAKIDLAFAMSDFSLMQLNLQLLQDHRHGIQLSPDDLSDASLMRSLVFMWNHQLDSSYFYYRQHQFYNDSSFRLKNEAQIQQIEAKNIFDNINSKLKSLRIEKLIYLFVILITMVFLIIVSIFYLKLNIKNKKLVSKSVDEVKTEETIKRITGFNKTKSTNIEKNEVGDSDKDHEKMLVLIDQLNKIMETEQLYLKPEINLNDVSRQLGTNRTYLSKAINTIIGLNFYDYINKMRIKHAISLIVQSKANYKVIHLYVDSGFGNRTSFNAAFDKFEGQTPSTFIKNYRSLLKNSNL